jgi:DNA-directed RNA polymerase specialized sigma24 family protein
MEPDPSVSQWLRQVQQGDPAGAQRLWERYFSQLVRLARGKLSGVALGVSDEEDIAISAFASFCRHAERGRFPDLADRNDLWRLLVVMTARKAAHVLRDEMRDKRGGGLDRAAIEIDAVIGAEPSPEFAAQCADELRRLLDRLRDPDLCVVAVSKLEGFTNDEVAERLNCAPRTVERKLQLIRQVWEASDDA